jgi:hypothetical protein
MIVRYPPRTTLGVILTTVWLVGLIIYGIARDPAILFFLLASVIVPLFGWLFVLLHKRIPESENVLAYLLLLATIAGIWFSLRLLAGLFVTHKPTP